MSFFSSLKDAEFARAAFTAAGLDFEAAVKANNVDVLKTAVAAAKPSADLATAENALKEALTENKTITAQNAQLVAAFTAVGANPEKPDTLKAALDAKISEGVVAATPKAARELVAKAGHPGVDDPVSTAPAQKRGDVKTLTRAQLDALSPREQSNFCRAGGKIID